MNDKTSALGCKWTACWIIKYEYIDLVCVYPCLNITGNKVYANECTLKIMMVTYCNSLYRGTSTSFNTYSNYESDRT